MQDVCANYMRSGKNAVKIQLARTSLSESVMNKVKDVSGGIFLK